MEFEEQFEKYYGRSARNELSFDYPPWASEPWEHKYRNLNHKFIKKIMQKNNRVQFEMSVVKTKIKHLKDRLTKKFK